MKLWTKYRTAPKTENGEIDIQNGESVESSGMKTDCCKEGAAPVLPLLGIRNLSKTFFGRGHKKAALRGMNLELFAGEIVGIIGESGSGKSTLLRLISGQIQGDCGEILFLGKDLKQYKRDLYRHMQMIFQDARASFNPSRTIGYTLDETKRHLCDEHTQNCDLLDMVGLQAEYEFKYPHQLSGGECQRAAIARAFCVMPDLLLCDEITSALDVSVQEGIIDLLLHLSRIHHVGVLFVSHDLPLISSFCDRVYIMEDGKCVESGRTDEVLRNPKAEYTKQLIQHIL